MSNSNLEGATQPNPPNSYPSNAGEFAARWNAADPEDREARVQSLVRTSETAYTCLMQQHEGYIANLTAESEDLRRLLEEAENRRVRDVQSVLDQRDDLRDVIEEAYTGALMVNGRYAADILGKVLPFE